MRVRSTCGEPGGLPLGSAVHFHSAAIATQPVHRFQIRPILHNYGTSATTPPSYIRVRAIVWACGRGQTHTQTRTQTRVTTIHFSWSTTHAKCNEWRSGLSSSHDSTETKLQLSITVTLCMEADKLQCSHNQSRLEDEGWYAGATSWVSDLRSRGRRPVEARLSRLPATCLHPSDAPASPRSVIQYWSTGDYALRPGR